MKGIFYHGSNSKIEKFLNDFPEKEGAINAEGPGTYFTNSKENAEMWGKFTYTVKLSPRKVITNQKPASKVNRKDLKMFLDMKSDEDYVNNRSLNIEKDKILTINEAIEYSNTEDEVWHFLRVEQYNGQNFKFMNAMSKLGYDALLLYKKGFKFDDVDKVYHCVVYNKDIVDIISLERNNNIEEVRKIVKECMKDILENSVHHIIKEYITNDTIYLRDYLSMSKKSKMKYLPYEFQYLFDDFLEETDTEFDMPKEVRQTNYADEPEEVVDMFDNNIELMTWLENNDRGTFDAFAEYLYNKIKSGTMPIHDSDYPAWSFFDDNPTMVKNQWLIHFTDNANAVAREGFRFGVDDMTKLGLTTHLGEFDKKYGGYNFAYLLSDFPKYAQGRGRYKYGKEAVIFNASGIKVWHYGDEEPQVIFYGNTARNIIPITEGENADFAIYGKKNRILFENDDLTRVVKWLVDNYKQYHKSMF